MDKVRIMPYNNIDNNENISIEGNKCEKHSIKLLSKVFTIHIIHHFLLMCSIKCRNPFMFYSIYVTYENCLKDISRKIYSEKAICET
jgi:hypothetical protein